MRKKLLKIASISLGLLFLVVLLAPLLFKGSLEDLLKKNINKNLNAVVEWEEMDLSLLRNFPRATVTVSNFTIITRAPFEGDTLASGARLKLNMGLTELFKKSDETIVIRSILLNEARINIHVDSLGNTNYDIAKKDNTESEGEIEAQNKMPLQEGGFAFSLQKYEIRDAHINYRDDASDMSFELQQVNHEGNGDLSAATTTLKTHTDAVVSFRKGAVAYLNKNTLTLDADFEIDLEHQKYTFLENEARINELPLHFDGYVQVQEQGSEMDVTFATPSSDFKNFLAVIPKVYVREIRDVQTTGSFEINGQIKGLANEEHIPMLDIRMQSDNASFKYPHLPKAVQNISIDARLKNETGLLKDTYLTVGNVTFRVDEELFTANGSIRNLTKNALVNLALKGTLNLANIERVLPLELEQNLSGIFRADVRSQFDMQALEKEQYERIQSSGTARLSDFTYSDPAFIHPIEISEAAIDLSRENILLNSFDARSGETDIHATGTVENLIPWIMAKQDLKGRFDLRSSVFNVNDFMASEGESATVSSEDQLVEPTIKIPDFLDATLRFTADKMIYDDLELKQTSGVVRVHEETAYLNDVRAGMFGGDVAFSGNVSTLNDIPTFAMNLDLQHVDIASSFQNLKLLQYLAPIAQALDGDLNTTLALTGELNETLVPDLSTLTGNALAQVLTAEINAENAPILTQLDEQLPFLNINELSLRDVATAVTFENGTIAVKPFDIQIDDVIVTLSGQHGLDKHMQYDAKVNVPAKHLGGEINTLLRKLDPKETDRMTVDIPIGVSGTMTRPQLNVDTRQAVSGITKRIIEKQKENAANTGIEILGDILGTGEQPKDSTATQTNTTTGQTQQIVKDIFGNIFKSKKKDSIDNRGL